MKNVDFSLTKRILITGGAGFIGGALIRRLLSEKNLVIFNLDKMSYASDLTSINNKLKTLKESSAEYYFVKADLFNRSAIYDAICKVNPDIVFHLAAESHVDRSINGPKNFIESNVVGTFNLLDVLKNYWDKLSPERQEDFRFIHVSTDEVFGSLYGDGSFTEKTPYDPRSPYSASKAASDHLVKAWYNTYGLPVITTNCGNNYGPWQFPEKLIPLSMIKGKLGKSIPLYGDGLNIRNWLYVDDHVDALLLVAQKGEVGESYCIGGSEEFTNLQVVKSICGFLDEYFPALSPHDCFIKLVEDRMGHDRKYSINSSKIRSTLGWSPKYNFNQGLKLTFDWFIKHSQWSEDRLIKI